MRMPGGPIGFPPQPVKRPTARFAAWLSAVPTGPAEFRDSARQTNLKCQRGKSFRCRRLRFGLWGCFAMRRCRTSAAVSW